MSKTNSAQSDQWYSQGVDYLAGALEDDFKRVVPAELMKPELSTVLDAENDLLEWYSIVKSILNASRNVGKAVDFSAKIKMFDNYHAGYEHAKRVRDYHKSSKLLDDLYELRNLDEKPFDKMIKCLSSIYDTPTSFIPNEYDKIIMSKLVDRLIKLCDYVQEKHNHEEFKTCIDAMGIYYLPLIFANDVSVNPIKFKLEMYLPKILIVQGFPDCLIGDRLIEFKTRSEQSLYRDWVQLLIYAHLINAMGYPINRVSIINPLLGTIETLETGDIETILNSEFIKMIKIKHYDEVKKYEKN